MKPCRNPGCYREAVVTVDIRGVGIRDLCQPCHTSLADLGMDLRAVDPSAPMPEWRKRALGADLTGRVLA